MDLIAESLGGRVADPDRYPELRTLLARIESACDPIEIILYGSRARGEATTQSDWDLKVIVADETPDRVLSPMFGWALQEGSGVHADISIARFSEFSADLGVPNSAASHILDDGILLVR